MWHLSLWQVMSFRVKRETKNSWDRCVLHVMTDIGFPASVSVSERCNRPLKALFRYEVSNLCCSNSGVSLHPRAAVGWLLPSHFCESCHPLGRRASKINRNLALSSEETPFPVSVKVGCSILVTAIPTFPTDQKLQ